MSLSRTQIVDWLYRCGDIFTKESDFLTGLDREIGDADHGLNMHRGFSKVVEKLPSIADKDIGFILKNRYDAALQRRRGQRPAVRHLLYSRRSGDPGPPEPDPGGAHQTFREGAEGVVNRGKAEPGDKTMCDVWLPVVESLRQSSEQHLSIPGALDAACEQAQAAVHATIAMQARKGRASYLGERSIGHQDPGATSVMLMVQMLAAAAKE